MTIIDCDVHQTWTDLNEIKKRMPPYLRQDHFQVPPGLWKSPVGVSRDDAKTPDGGLAGSSPDYLIEHHLEAFGISRAILTGNSVLAIGVHHHAGYAASFCSAYNDALIETWLAHDDRFFGALIVAPQDPFVAAAEIRRVGAHPKITQVLMCSGQRTPLGQRYFWPIYEAALEMELPMSIHPGSEGKGIANGFIAGPPSSYMEWHTNLPQNYMGHLCSLVCEGVFEQFPGLKFIAIEGGLAWIPGLLWRLNKNWKALRSSCPWIRRLPSEYLIENVRFTSQPIEEPSKPAHLLQLFEMIHAESTLMFSSDYPHWDNDSPRHALPRMPGEMAERIYCRNAAELYGFEDLLAPAAVSQAEVAA